MPSSFSLSRWFSRKDDPDTPSHNTPTVPAGSSSLWTRYKDTSDPILVFALGAASGVGATLAWRRWGMRLLTAEWVTPNELARRRWVRGVVTR